MAFPIVTAAELIGQLYVGYFGRAADPAGLDYWVNRYNDGMSLLAIANSFAVQPEATALYSYLAAPSLGDPHAFIAAIYGDLFNRAPDAAGLAYWVTQLTVQGTPPGQMVLDIISGAQGSDRTTIENKTHVAVDHAQASHSVLDAHAAVASVTADPATVAAVLGASFVTFQSGLSATMINLVSGQGTTGSSWYNASVSETIWLVGDPANTSGGGTFNLGSVSGSTAVFGNILTGPLSIIGSFGPTNTLLGSSAADTIVAKGTGVGFGSNFVWGGAGGDTETGVAGGAQDNVGTVFLIDDKGEAPGGVHQGPNAGDLHITNFHGSTDTLLVNPTQLALGDVPVFIGTAVNFGQALALLAGGGAARTQAVYQQDIGALWIDADNNGLLNARDLEVFVDLSGPGLRPGSFNFGNLLEVFDGSQVSDYIEARLPRGSNMIFSGALMPGEQLWAGGQAANDKLTLANGSVAKGILIGFEKLEIAAGKFGELSIAQWNGFWPHIAGGLGATTAIFSDGWGTREAVMTAVAAITNYDFSGLSNGITLSTEVSSGGPMHGPGAVVGTRHADIFIVGANELEAGFSIDGAGSVDKLIVSTDAKGLDLDVATANIEHFVLEAGSTANVLGANGGGILVEAIGNTVFTMGVGGTQTYRGGVAGAAGKDQITFANGADSISTMDLDDIVRSIVGGAITGALDGGDGAFDALSLANGDDIAGAAAIVGFEILELASGASVTMTAETWNHFVGADGVAVLGHVVSGAGLETVVLTATTAATAAYIGDDPIEGYVLSNVGGDLLRIGEGSTAYHAQVTLTAGGSDFITLDDTLATFGGNNVAADLFGFTGGAIVGSSDVLQIQHGGIDISNRGFETVIAAATDIVAGTGTIVVASNVAAIVGGWNQAAARTALDAAIEKIATGEYTMVVYNGSDADVMSVKIGTADSLADATVDLVGVLHNVGADTLVGFNFS